MNSRLSARCSAFSRRSRLPGRAGRRVGLTLVEMLVAMALSLLVILAVAQAFQLIGDNVLASRAVLEMSGQLRGVTNQMQADLAGATVPVRPWPDASSGSGYFEYHEGPLWDMGLGSSIPHQESSVGDIDDVLMLTSRAVGRPFAGQILGQLVVGPDPTRPRLIFDPTQTNAIESQIAEIAWFTRFNDQNGNSQVDPGEVTLHRRQLLVLPNLDLSDPSIQALTPGQFYNAFDISVRYQRTSPPAWEKIANSLKTLSQRENRIAHNVSGGFPISEADPLIVREPPYFLSRALLVPQGTVVTLGADGAPGTAGVNDDGNRLSNGSSSIDEMGEAGHFNTDDRTAPIEDVLPAFAAYGEPIGNDVMLSYVMAFDIKAFDTKAKLQSSTDGTDALLPGEPGYNPNGAMIGQGGYVDLFYARYQPGGWPNSGVLPLGITSDFAGPPNVKSGLFTSFLTNDHHPATYDTWSFFYEHDGLDQPAFSLDTGRNDVAVDPDGDGIIDNATNGFDDDNTNGVDDVGERETAPPYPVALRGIQIRFRVIDNDTRQVRQVTVLSDFLPE